MRTRAFKLAIASATVGVLTLITAGTALAAPGGEKGPAAPAANMGLGEAVINVMNHAADKGANVTWGTHNAVGRIVVNNPAMDACQPPFSLLPDNPFCRP